MTPEQFCYWLQGAFEVRGLDLTSREQMIADHLKMVFEKKTPPYQTQVYQNPTQTLPGVTGTGPGYFPPTVIC